MKKLKEQLINIAKSAKESTVRMQALPSATKNKVLKEWALALESRKKDILKANKKDLKGLAASGASPAFIDRLRLTPRRISEMSLSLKALIKLPDPVGTVIKAWRRPNGLWIHKVRSPIGVIAIIYESRPNVTCDCIGLCFKSGNCVILRGGSESLNSNLSIFQALKPVTKKYGIPEGAINIVALRKREAVGVLLKLDNYIDLVIPRGGEGLIRRVASLSRIPVIKHYKGICHVYVDRRADLGMAEEICFNAKVQRPGVCNAMESMLVHKDIASAFLPEMIKRFFREKVKINGCLATEKIIKKNNPEVFKANLFKRATEKDYRTEYLGLALSVAVVDSLQDAVSHINYYGSHHSDSIVTSERKNAMEFLKQVDSACVYVNASTRFTDGGQFGMGAEIGISTDKLHARGPMALEELTTYKYMIFGNGQIRT